MTIRRQYSLPNCSLVLDGWTGDVNFNEGGNGRPLMSILVNAECRFLAEEHHSSVLQGDRDFLESLVRVVNNYAQSVLSGLSPEPTQDWVGESVQIKPLPEKNRHQLQLTRTEDGKPEEVIKIDLTTVELFDLVEAIDQLLNDGTTLPDLTLSLHPHSRKIRSRHEPLVKKAQPAITGVASLAVAAIALFFVPIPEIREPEPAEANGSRREEPLPNERGRAIPSGIKESLADLPRITNSEELAALGSNLQTTISQNLQQEVGEELLRYRVWVTPTGDVLGYEQLAGPNFNITETPVLPNLLSLPLEGNNPQPTAVGQLEVTFNPNGVVAVEPE
jgi:hypothetical protein